MREIRTREKIALIGGFLFLFAFEVYGEEIENSEIRSRIHLLPIVEKGPIESKIQKYWLSELKSQQLVDTVTSQSFSKWKVFEDEYVSFRYPDDPNIHLELKRPKDNIPMMGGPIGTTDNTFIKGYQLAVGKQTYGLLLLEKIKKFDDGICFCGAVAFQKLLFHNGSLCRFDLLKNGRVKKVQILGDGYRIVVFESTHMAMARDVYLDFSLGITLKSGVVNRGAIKKEMIEKYGFQGRLGFMEKGMSKKEIVGLMGVPKLSTESFLTYEQTKDRIKTTTRIDLQNSSFQGFGKDWQKSIQLMAKRGTVDWIVEAVEGKEQRGASSFSSAKKKSLSEDTVKYIFDRFIQIGPLTKSEDWNRLCQALNGLRARGYKDERILPIIRNRFLEPKTVQHFAGWLLHEYDPEGSNELFAKRVKITLDEARELASSEVDVISTLIFSMDSDLHNLLSFLDKNHPERLALILEGMDHPLSYIRGSAYYFWESIPEKEVRPRLLRGINDQDGSVRRRASAAFAKSYGEKEDLALLKERILIEKNKTVLKNLKKAVRRLK